MTLTIQPGDIIHEDSLLSALSQNEASMYSSWLTSLDAILVLGGGVPRSPKEPPIYVQRRCDVVAKLFNAIKKEKSGKSLPNIICLSAGTAHLPQYILPSGGLPLWEATSSAAYLMYHPQHPIDKDNLFVETTSYDTISNAYFARTSFIDVVGWKRLLVVTNEFHVHRSKAIFDWIFSVPSDHTSDYEIYYLSCNNAGLSSQAVDARRAHEERGKLNIESTLSQQYTTLREVFDFLTTKHDFYTASRLVNAATAPQGERIQNNLLELSYGRSYNSSQSTIEVRNGKMFISVDVFHALIFVVIIIWTFVAVLHYARRNISHAHAL